jgi:hypothetical protein
MRHSHGWTTSSGIVIASRTLPVELDDVRVAVLVPAVAGRQRVDHHQVRAVADPQKLHEVRWIREVQRWHMEVPEVRPGRPKLAHPVEVGGPRVLRGDEDYRAVKPAGGWHDPGAFGSYELDDTLSAEDSAMLSALMSHPRADQLEFLA